MKATEFTYWLEGALELNDSKSLDQRKTTVIKSTLAQVKVHEESPSGVFSTFLKGFFEMSEAKELTESQVSKIKEKLKDSLRQKVKPKVESTFSDRPPLGARC